MSNAVLDRPVAPSDWVHETHTAGADAGSTVEVRSVDRSGYELFLQSLSHLTGSSHTGSIHVVAEQIYVAQPRVILITLRGNLDHVRDRLLAAITGTVATFAEPPLPAIDDQGSSSHSRALRAADDLKIWLDLTYDDIAAMSGLAKRTIHHWRATGAQPRPATVRRLLEIHALVQAMRRKLGPERFDEWIRTGTPSPLQLLQAGEWDAAQQAAYGILFSRRRRERDFDGYSPYDPETDFPVGTPSVIADIEHHYILDDRTTVLHFLRAHPNITTILVDCAVLIPEHFPDAALFLRVVATSPTGDAPDGRRLVLFIATDLGEEHAMAQMDRLMTEWRPDARSRTGEAFSIGLAYGTNATAVELAAQRFMQTHSAGHKAYRELAQRLLYSEPGSLEEGMARAELAAGLAGGQDTAPVSGGDALAVLARLRRQAGTPS